MRDHMVIFDMQLKPDSVVSHLPSIGQYIVDKKPDVIIVIGDFFDMHSLSSYDRGTKKAEGARYEDDIRAGVDGMKMMLGPMFRMNRVLAEQKRKQYKPEMHFTIGNHEQRIERHVNANPLLDGVLGYQNLRLERFGFQVHDYLTPVIVDGIEYVHFVQNRNSPNPKASSKASIEQTNMSVTQGHRPCLDIHTSWADDKGMMWSITCGASYLDYEDYKSTQGNKHWRGIVHKHNVNNGDFDPHFISIKSLMKEYGDV